MISVIISPERPPREGWAEAFRAAGSSREDELLLENAAREFGFKDWH